jgi:hypothetical protein
LRTCSTSSVNCSQCTSTGADEFPDRHFGAARSFGLVAQDVEAVLPGLVVTDAQGFKAIKYSELPLYLLQALKSSRPRTMP